MKQPIRTKPLPPCAVSMGCLCAGHARGNAADAPCDTREVVSRTRRRPLSEQRTCPTYRVLQVSTAHVPRYVAQLIESNELNGVVLQGEYGWIVPAGGLGGDVGVAEINRVCEYAREIGADYVWFDRDAYTLAQLPQWDW